MSEWLSKTYLLQSLQHFCLMVQEHLALVRSHIHIITAPTTQLCLIFILIQQQL